MPYEKLLDKLYKEVKPIQSGERFEVPPVKGHVEGVKTIVSNLFQIASLIRRKPEHLIKFLSREVASLAIIEGERVIFNRKLNSDMLNKKIQSYVNEFVLCSECKKPDTELMKQGDFMFL